MSTTRYSLPQDWTAEQATFIYSFIADLEDAIWATYEEAILQRWREQRRIPHPPGNQRDDEPVPSHYDKPEPLDLALDDEIPW